MKSEETNEYWQRLQAVIERAGMNPNSFARHIGLPRAENIYRIKRGSNALSRRLVDRITEHFPEIRKGWLLWGEGCMLLDGEQTPDNTDSAVRDWNI